MVDQGGQRENGRDGTAQEIAAVASGIFAAAAGSFPVCSASDEFYFFPQVPTEENNWSKWDDFSEDIMAEFTGKLSRWENTLAGLEAVATREDDAVEARSLKGFVRSLREQISLVRFHRTQPTFHLTVAVVGLVEAMNSTARDAWMKRVCGLPEFLDRAARLLDDVPALFLELGMNMQEETMAWISSMSDSRPGLGPVREALRRFGKRLEDIPAKTEFLLPGDLLEKTVRDHFGCGSGVEGCLGEIGTEIEEMESILKEEAGRLAPGLTWREAYASMPVEAVPDEGALRLYSDEVARLRRRCIDLGLIGREMADSCPVRVAAVPPSLMAVRSADSYSARPGHPPAGGTFYVFGGNESRRGGRGLSREYKMTTAHETYPGHHLLDAFRWNSPSPSIRHVERPLFYEGWACFAEDMMARTGYFSGDWDRFILAARRLRRAVRGKVDLLVQSKRMNLDQAALLLSDLGMDLKQARSAVRKYTIRPGYQVCYTVGQRGFNHLYRTGGGGDISRFALTVLSGGEIGLEDLKGKLAVSGKTDCTQNTPTGRG